MLIIAKMPSGYKSPMRCVAKTFAISSGWSMVNSRLAACGRGSRRRSHDFGKLQRPVARPSEGGLAWVKLESGLLFTIIGRPLPSIFFIKNTSYALWWPEVPSDSFPPKSPLALITTSLPMNG